MATRTPKLQQRSQYHSYWGQYSYSVGASPPWDDGSNMLPGAPGNPLSSPDDFARLEVGDIAATTGTLDQTGLWVCVDRPTSSTCVWRRLDNAALQQTIRDAHVIVVAHQSGSFNLSSGVSGTDALLNINPQLAGVSADFIDTGNGVGLAAAIAAAGAIASAIPDSGVDVRLRPCDITLSSGSALTLPHRVNLIGAGKGASILRSTQNDQRVLLVSGSSTIRDLTLSSTPPTSNLTETDEGVLHISGVSGTTSHRDVYIDNVDVFANVGSSSTATARHGIVVDVSAVVNVHIHACRVRADFPYYDDGIPRPERSVAIIDRSNRSYQVSCVSCTFENFDIGFSTDTVSGFFAGNVRFANCFFDKIAQTGFRLSVDNGGQIFGLEVSNTRILMQASTSSAPQEAVLVEVGMGGSEIMNASFCGVHAAFLGSAPPGGSYFARVNVTPTAGGPFVRGLKFVACGNDHLGTTFYQVTHGIQLIDGGTGGIVGGDVLCTWNVTGSTLNIVSGTPTWEQAHLV